MATEKTTTTRVKKRPSFFKIMIGDFTDTIRIPLKFTKRFGEKIHSDSFLKNPTGKSFKVKVKKIEDEYFFRTGWQLFVRKNSLEFGDLLIFTYVGSSIFRVKIYDKTGCEKDKKKNSLEQKNNNQDGEQVTCDKGKKQSTERNDAKADVSSKEDHLHLASTKRKDGLDSTIQKESLSSQTVKHHLQSIRRRCVASREMLLNRAIEAAKEFKSENPFCRIILSPSYVSKSFMNLPCSFVRCFTDTHLRGNTRRHFNVRLGILDGRKWSAQVTISKNKAYICQGWRAFVAENSLREGDICFFEMIKSGELDIKVSIYRVHDNAKPLTLQQSEMTATNYYLESS